MSIKIHEPEMLDDKGYPTEALITKITKWEINTYDDCQDLLEFVEKFWWMSEWGIRRAKRRFRQVKGGRLIRQWFISTGGWSGNEDIIVAMEANTMFRVLAWYSSQRGGHYEFRT